MKTKTENKGAGFSVFIKPPPIPRPIINRRSQNKRKAGMTSAAKRDGYKTWSNAITLWIKGEAVLVRVTRPAVSETEEYTD